MVSQATQKCVVGKKNGHGYHSMMLSSPLTSLEHRPADEDQQSQSLKGVGDGPGRRPLPELGVDRPELGQQQRDGRDAGRDVDALRVLEEPGRSLRQLDDRVGSWASQSTSPVRRHTRNVMPSQRPSQEATRSSRSLLLKAPSFSGPWRSRSGGTGSGLAALVEAPRGRLIGVASCWYDLGEPAVVCGPDALGAQVGAKRNASSPSGPTWAQRNQPLASPASLSSRTTTVRPVPCWSSSTSALPSGAISSRTLASSRTGSPPMPMLPSASRAV